MFRLTAGLALGLMLVACSEEGTMETSEEELEQQPVEELEEVAPADFGLDALERPQRDKDRDENRKPEDVVAKMLVEPGDVVIDIGSGSGYYAEVFARAVGPDGKVYAVNNPSTAERFPQAIENLETRTGYLGNLVPLLQNFDEINAGEKADAAFMGLMYHEVIRQEMDAAGINSAVYEALKPGGIYALTIHRAVEGVGRVASSEYHRTDPVLLEDEVQAAGFELVEKNVELLNNPDDPLNILVFDETIRGNSSRILYIFRKPAE